MNDELLNSIHELYEVLRTEGYGSKEEEVRALILDTRRALTGASGLGKWEAAELDYANAAVAQNWLCLALVCANKAIAVSELPAEEYEFGFNYGRKT
jgi:hypothetical protein